MEFTPDTYWARCDADFSRSPKSGAVAKPRSRGGFQEFITVISSDAPTIEGDQTDYRGITRLQWS
jgi:hypothetical protein